MNGKHRQEDSPQPGEVAVDTDGHTVVREDETDPVVGRIRTTPTKHDGSQRKR